MDVSASELVAGWCAEWAFAFDRLAWISEDKERALAYAQTGGEEDRLDLVLFHASGGDFLIVDPSEMQAMAAALAPGTGG